MTREKSLHELCWKDWLFMDYIFILLGQVIAFGGMATLVYKIGSEPLSLLTILIGLVIISGGAVHIKFVLQKERDLFRVLEPLARAGSSTYDEIINGDETVD